MFGHERLEDAFSISCYPSNVKCLLWDYSDKHANIEGWSLLHCFHPLRWPGFLQLNFIYTF